MASKFRARSFPQSVNYAVAGLVHSFRTQRNMRVHFCMTVLVVLLGIVFGLTQLELAVLSLTIGLVIVSELINTSIETVVDLITEEYHPLAAVAKNVAAGAVLIAACSSVVVGYLLFFERVAGLHQEALARSLNMSPYITLLALIAVSIAVLAVKAKGAPVRMQGGMPSAHTAVACSLATSIFFLSNSGAVALLAAALTILVGQSRVEAGIHSVVEVTAGGLIGFLLTVLIFQLIP